MPPTRFGHIRISSVHPKAAAQLSSRPRISRGIGGAALAGISVLSGDQGADQEQALVASAHGERGGSHPADRTRMRRQKGRRPVETSS